MRRLFISFDSRSPRVSLRSPGIGWAESLAARILALALCVLVSGCAGEDFFSPDERLHAAAVEGDVAGFRRLLDDSPEIVDGRAIADLTTPLLRTIAIGRLDLAQVLLDHGADLDAQEYRGRTALHIAVERDDVEAIRFLLDRGADVFIRDFDEVSPLLLASIGGNENARRFLRLHVPPQDLVEAVVTGDVAAFATYLAADASAASSPRFPPHDLRQPLHFAAMTGHGELFESLHAVGASLEARDETGCTPLLLASESGRIEECVRLVALGASILATDGAGMSSLHRAALGGNLELVRRLLALGADPGQRDRYGHAPADWAHRNGHREVVALLQGALVRASP